MNLVEIILALKDKSPTERAKLLNDWGVDPVLVEHIQRCFDEKGRIFDSDGNQIHGIVSLNDSEVVGLPVIYDLTQNPDGGIETASFRVIYCELTETPQEFLEIKITSEGIIMDLWRDDDCIWTYAQTFDDIREQHG